MSETAKATREPRFSIELMVCPHGHQALAIGNTRITAAVCCKTWNHVRHFYLIDSPDNIAELLVESGLARNPAHD